MILLALILLFVCIVLPIGIAWRIWRLDELSRASWLTKVADGVALALFILLIGRWDIAGFYTRYALIALLAVAIFLSWRRHAKRPWRAREGPPLWPTFFSLALFSAGVAYLAVGMFGRHAPRPLDFPLEGGRFVVVQGGSNTLLNRHYSHPAQRYASDIVAINRAGFRAAGVMPSDPARYVAYGATVVSPCSGRVTKTQDGLLDLNPPKADPKHAAGNHVVISCSDMHVELAHLRRGSITVKAGDDVIAGNRIALVGNSGNTTEPHLHIHAIDQASGKGVEIAFDGKVPARNRTF